MQFHRGTYRSRRAQTALPPAASVSAPISPSPPNAIPSPADISMDTSSSCKSPFPNQNTPTLQKTADSLASSPHASKDYPSLCSSTSASPQRPLSRTPPSLLRNQHKSRRSNAIARLLQHLYPLAFAGLLVPFCFYTLLGIAVALVPALLLRGAAAFVCALFHRPSSNNSIASEQRDCSVLRQPVARLR